MRRAAYDDYTSLPFFIGGRCVCDQIHCNCNSWDREIPSEGLIDLQMVKESAHIHPSRRSSIGGSDFVFMVLLFAGKVMVAFLVTSRHTPLGVLMGPLRASWLCFGGSSWLCESGSGVAGKRNTLIHHSSISESAPVLSVMIFSTLHSHPTPKEICTVSLREALINVKVSAGRWSLSDVPGIRCNVKRRDPPRYSNVIVGGPGTEP